MARMNKNSLANLEKRKKFTKENAKENGRKGGIKNGENAKERKTLREAVEKALENKYGIVLSNIEKGLEEGNIQWYELARKITEGENIKLSGSVSANLETSEERIKAFEELMK